METDMTKFYEFVKSYHEAKAEFVRFIAELTGKKNEDVNKALSKEPQNFFPFTTKENFEQALTTLDAQKYPLFNAFLNVKVQAITPMTEYPKKVVNEAGEELELYVKSKRGNSVKQAWRPKNPLAVNEALDIDTTPIDGYRFKQPEVNRLPDGSVVYEEVVALGREKLKYADQDVMQFGSVARLASDTQRIRNELNQMQIEDVAEKLTDELAKRGLLPDNGQAIGTPAQVEAALQALIGQNQPRESGDH